MDWEKYTAEALHQPGDDKTYKHLLSNPKSSIASELNQFSGHTAHYKNYILLSLSSSDKPKKTRIPTVYLLPKIHKTGIPGHKIVTDYNSPT